MKSAIVFGATGAVGSALVKELLDNNIEVLALSRTNSPRLDVIPKHPLVTIMDCGLETIEKLENTTGKDYDVFYHFAWAGTTGEARNDMQLQKMNLKYSLDAVRAAKRFGCSTFIGAGSQAEYGRSSEPLTDITIAKPENGYGIAKLCAGYTTRFLAGQLEMRHIWVRILSVYGPNDGAQSMVMSTIEKLKQDIKPKLTKGEQMWDYLYSGDAARAFRLLGERGRDGEFYVLGSGNARPLKEYMEDIRDIVAPKMELDIGAVPYSENQVMYLCADISKLQNDVGFNPETSFRDGIKEILKTLNT